MTCTGAPTCGACGLPIHENEMGLRHRGTRTLHSEARCIDLLLQKVDFLKRDVHILEQQRDNALADYNELREAAQMALAVLEQWDDLIEHQYTGTRPAMTDMHYAAQATVPVMKALREALGDEK